jgi:alkylation response protein AidB-like acyl-CoA dehydrogenase
MDFDFSDEQRQLGDAAQRFVAGEYGFERRKAILQSHEGFSREVWKQLGELGFLALLVPEENGGMGAGPVELLLLMSAIGKGLLLEPYLPSAVLGTRLVVSLGSPEQKESLLPQLATGEIIGVPAHGEAPARYDLRRVDTQAFPRGDEFVLHGEKTAVLHGPSADLLFVSARTSGSAAEEDGISLFVVPRDSDGLAVTSYRTVDGQRAADVKLDGVRVPRSAMLGPEGGAFEAIAAAAEVGIAALCAEAVGALQASLDATLEYTRARHQFGQPIGKFQALQHRMADMFIHVEQARSMSYLAAMRCQDSQRPARVRAVSGAKALIGQAARFVGQQSIQLHGGMGMTDELAISHYFRRLTAIELTLGDTEYHLERFARAGDSA